MGSYPVDVSTLAEENGSDLAEPTQTLYELLNQSVRQFPDRTALVSCHQPWNQLPALGFFQDDKETDYLRWSYAQLNIASDLFASYLTGSGVSQGDAIVVVLPSCAEWALCFWAAAKLGCPFVPINSAIVSRVKEIQHILNALERIGALIISDASIVKLLSENAPAATRETRVKMVLGSVEIVGWKRFENAFTTSEPSQTCAAEQTMDDTVLIVLTSGTTALPKGCPHSNKTVASMCERHKIMYSLEDTRVSCNHMPLFHLAGVMESLWAWACGGKVVYPNKSFNAHATLDALDKEQCTDMCLVPSMLHAMVDHPILSTKSTNSLGLIKLAANDVMGSDARACSEILHAKVVTNIFGMTETSGMTEIFPWREGLCKDSEPFPVGRMAPGARARICAPGSRVPLKRGMVGELHQGGKTISNRYIGGGDEAMSFYSDETDLWHISGDRAVMAETGEITVLGRYKDIINRAGENISPVTMERVLNHVEGVQSSQVVGVPDKIAGEVPVAVIKMRNDGVVSKSVLHDRIVKELGVAFALERIIDLKELALDDFPVTATGKVRKVDVRHLVRDFLNQESEASARMTAPEPTEVALTRIWARFSGVPEDCISPTMSLEGMVDSVTIMRFRSQVTKELGKTFSLEELNRYPRIVEQAKLLDSQEETGVLRGPDTVNVAARVGPPQLSDVVHSRGKQAMFNEVKQKTESKLHPLGLSWDQDVEEVLPFYDFFRVRLAQSLRFRIRFVFASATTKQLRSSLETVLAVHGILRTIMVDSPLAGPSWVMIRPSNQWYQLSIKEGGTVRKPKDMWTTDLSFRDSAGSMDSKPIPLFYITTYFVEATQSAGFVAFAHHSVFDAHSVRSILVEDLAKVLHDPIGRLPARPAYSLFAKSYYNYRTSVPAQLNLEYYASRFKGISRCNRGGLWPAETFKSVNAPPSKSADHLVLKGNMTPGLTGLTKRIKIDMSNNEYLKVHKIPHIIAMKAAVSIFNMQQTGHPYAFFSALQMCRTWPFMEPQIADRLPDLMQMPGTTIDSPLEIIHLPAHERISALLHRMYVDQKEQTAHAHIPTLGLLDYLDKADADFLGDMFGRQAFNYHPVLTPDPNAPLQDPQIAGHANLSFMWWCGMVDAETVQMKVTWLDEVFGRKDAEMALDGFERNLKWLVDGDNWEKTIEECDS